MGGVRSSARTNTGARRANVRPLGIGTRSPDARGSVTEPSGPSTERGGWRMSDHGTLRSKLEAAFESDTPSGFEWAKEYVSKIPGVPMSDLKLDLRDWGLST